jgi:dolichol-phosphate mannosyltransferase
VTHRSRLGPAGVALLILQGLAALRVAWRLVRSAGGKPLAPCVQQEEASDSEQAGSVAVIVPVLNERARLAPCLAGLLTQGREVVEILVVDGGSQDGTQALVKDWEGRDRRIRLLEAAPVPADWNGKAWGLERGRHALSCSVEWILSVDADVRPAPGLTCALLQRARRERLAALSVATLQELPEDPWLGLLHPSLLATLIYRFGSPGQIFRSVPQVQANGQCFLIRREALEACGGFAAVRHSLCEDVTLGRLLVLRGWRVGFVEGGPLVSVCMYTTAREAWENWTRSLPVHDQFAGLHTFLGWLEVLCVQALPLPLLLFTVGRRASRKWRFLLMLNVWLLLLRAGILVGMARAYRHRPWTYWLSPLCDLPVALQLARQALRRRHVWRGRVIVRGGAPGGL